MRKIGKNDVIDVIEVLVNAKHFGRSP